MRRAALILCVLGLGTWWLYAASLPDPPSLLPYQGYLRSGPDPVDRSVHVDARLYEGDVEKWSGSFDGVEVKKGRFSLQLPVSAALFEHYRPLDLELTIDGVTLSPRQRLHPAAQAISAGNANRSVGDFTVDGGLNAAGALAAGGPFVLDGPLTISGDRGLTFAPTGGDPDGGSGLAYRPAADSDAVALRGAGAAGARVVAADGKLRVAGNLGYGGTMLKFPGPRGGNTYTQGGTFLLGDRALADHDMMVSYGLEAQSEFSHGVAFLVEDGVDINGTSVHQTGFFQTYNADAQAMFFIHKGSRWSIRVICDAPNVLAFYETVVLGTK